MVWQVLNHPDDNTFETVSEAELIRRIRSGAVGADTPVRNDEQKDWAPLGGTDIWRSNADSRMLPKAASPDKSKRTLKIAGIVYGIAIAAALMALILCVLPNLGSMPALPGDGNAIPTDDVWTLPQQTVTMPSVPQFETDAPKTVAETTAGTAEATTVTETEETTVDAADTDGEHPDPFDAYDRMMDELIEEYDIEITGYESILLDADDIPELVLDVSPGDGAILLTYSDGQAAYEWLGEFGRYTYAEQGNLLVYSGGTQGVYYDNLFTIADGQIVRILRGEQMLLPTAEDGTDEDTYAYSLIDESGKRTIVTADAYAQAFALE